MSTSAVVASLTEGSVNPFSCMSLSPSREYAVAAAKANEAPLRHAERNRSDHLRRTENVLKSASALFGDFLPSARMSSLLSRMIAPSFGR